MFPGSELMHPARLKRSSIQQNTVRRRSEISNSVRHDARALRNKGRRASAFADRNFFRHCVIAPKSQSCQMINTGPDAAEPASGLGGTLFLREIRPKNARKL